MEVNAIAATATAAKAAQLAVDVNIAAQKKAMDIAKSNGELVLQLLQQSMGIGQNINVIA